MEGGGGRFVAVKAPTLKLFQSEQIRSDGLYCPKAQIWFGLKKKRKKVQDAAAAPVIVAITI